MCVKVHAANLSSISVWHQIISMVKERVVGVKAKIRTAPDVGGQKTAIVITLLPPYQVRVNLLLLLL